MGGLEVLRGQPFCFLMEMLWETSVLVECLMVSDAKLGRSRPTAGGSSEQKQTQQIQNAGTGDVKMKTAARTFEAMSSSSGEARVADVELVRERESEDREQQEPHIQTRGFTN